MQRVTMKQNRSARIHLDMNQLHASQCGINAFHISPGLIASLHMINASHAM
jgi:hypothetical protein